jgi:hypothetical protein
MIDNEGNNLISQTRSATAAAQTGSGADWNAPEHAFTDDSLYTSARLEAPQTTTKILLLHGFNFQIPTNATVKGLRLAVRRAAGESESATLIYDQTIRLLDDLQPVGASKITEIPWPWPPSLQLYGSNNDLWEHEWTPETLNDNGFGAALAAALSNQDNEPQIYYVELTAFYLLATLHNLVQQCANDLADPDHLTWSEDDLAMWLTDAIADYTEHFPRRIRHILTAAAGKTVYELPPTFLYAATVQLNGRFLSYRARHDPKFGADNFDIYQPHAYNEQAELVIGAAPTNGQTIIVTAAARHDANLTLQDGITVPAHHHRLLKAYVRWQATMQRQSRQEASPTSNSSLLMSQLAVNTDRRHRAYLRMLAKALDANAPDSGHAIWSGDAGDGLQRTY